MLIKSNNLIGLPVFTQSEQRLGVVRAFDVEVDSHTIIRYFVKPAGIAAMLGREDLIIAAKMVVSITEERMTVQDSSVPSVAKNSKKRAFAIGEEVVPALSRVMDDES